MPTIHDIQRQLRAINVPDIVRGTLGAELVPLTQLLGDDEPIRAFVAGKWQGDKAVLVATPKRLIFASGGILSRSSESVFYDKLADIQFKQGFVGGTIDVDGRKIESVRSDMIQRFVETVNQLRIKPTAPVQPQGDIAAQLTQLKALFDAGALTEDEYAKAKSKVLGG